MHAKANYSRKSFTKVQTQDLVIKFALEKWGQVDSFSAGAIAIHPNSKTTKKKNWMLKRAKTEAKK